MKTIILMLILFFPCIILSQNSIENVLSEVEKNNTTLLAYKQSFEAQKIGNKTGIFLENPKAEINYLLGNPSTIGNRTDFSISQSFDFPTAYSYKKRIANARNMQSDFEYQSKRKEILFQTRQICIELIYYNLLQIELHKRLQHANAIALAYQAKFDKGEANILERNKAELNLLKAKKEIEGIEIEHNSLLSELSGLNGGKPILFADSIYPKTDIPQDYDQWYVLVEQNNPDLLYLKKEMDIYQNQIKLNKALSLPKFSTGYMSETVVGQKYQGLSIGISVPLFENRNIVKFAKAKQIAVQDIVNDTKLQLFNQLKIQHTKVIGLMKYAQNYRENLKSFSNTDLLKKALDKGEISLIEYMFELSLYYENLNAILEAERDAQKAILEMTKY